MKNPEMVFDGKHTQLSERCAWLPSAWIFSTSNVSSAANGSAAFLHITVLRLGSWNCRAPGPWLLSGWRRSIALQDFLQTSNALHSHWTGKKTSIDFDQNWATFMVNFARNASSSQRFTPSRLAEGEMSFFLQSEIHCSVRSRYMRPRWEMAPRYHTRTRRYLRRHSVQLLNHFFLWLICVFFFFSLLDVPRQTN